jgi:hypothetical protein
MIQIIRIEPGKIVKPDDVIETDAAPLKSEQTCFAQMAQNPVDCTAVRPSASAR